MSVRRVYYVHDMLISRHAVIRQNIGRFLKGDFSHRKMPPFRLQKTAF